MSNSISLPVAPPSLLQGSPNLAQLHAALHLDDSESNAEQRVVLPTSDGLELQATLFEPQVQARAVAMLAPATGVPQRYYAPFARWLALQGYAVITFDYRGMGASPAGAQPPSMRDWMLEDLPAVLRAAKHRASPQVGTRRLPLLWVGHSLGGHALAVLDGIEALDAVVCIGSQLPSLHRWPAGHARWGAATFFKWWLPLWVRLAGHLPGWALGGGLPIPGPAALDWSRWGQMDNYFASDAALRPHWRAHRFQGVAQLWCVSDDWVFGPEPAVKALEQAFTDAPGQAQTLRLHPQDHGFKALGHFGAFRRGGEKALWPFLLGKIEAAVPALRPDVKKPAGFPAG
ncbi:MAG: serine aminopeptidase domain-containing protein [Burkholderiales bacterium]